MAVSPKKSDRLTTARADLWPMGPILIRVLWEEYLIGQSHYFVRLFFILDMQSESMKARCSITVNPLGYFWYLWCYLLCFLIFLFFFTTKAAIRGTASLKNQRPILLFIRFSLFLWLTLLSSGICANLQCFKIFITSPMWWKNVTSSFLCSIIVLLFWNNLCSGQGRLRSNA